MEICKGQEALQIQKKASFPFFFFMMIKIYNIKFAILAMFGGVFFLF
jgi:uncharacterized membrane protein SpoIIM required for sporulation